MSGKVIISVVSLILVVGVAIGVVVAVNKKGEDPDLQAQEKNVQVICQDTDDHKLCRDTLSSVKGVNASDPKAYIAAAIKATTDSVIKALNMSDRLSTEYGNNDNGVKMALDDCKDLLQSSMASLQYSTDLVRNNNLDAIHFQAADMRNWLSAVISYQQACMENFDDSKDGEKKIKEQLHVESLDHVQKITGITLDIITGLSHILEKFGLKLNLKPASRRLFEVDSEGYPSWFSASDRKLLGKGWRSHVTPNVIVAKDGSGQFKTVADAIASYPKEGVKGRYVIYVKTGVYDEYITVPKNAVNILMYGDGPLKTIITGHKNFAAGTKTMQTATFGENFENTLYYAEYNNAGPGADVSGRIKWKGYHGLISRKEATQFTAAEFLKAGPNAGTDWLKALRVPHALGFNKAKALKVLCAKLYEMERFRLQSSRSKLRSEQIGSGDRSERIRTYNFPQGRVTDHRVSITYHSIDDVMQGENLDVFIDALLLQEEVDAVATFSSQQSQWIQLFLIINNVLSV
ncbi:hypothetical protein RJT34_19270 [Clitoria ternatea]|uniref:Pectinesterase inhibitor domain-containing protein n=1 Tax=Clitoria ternatea TaxID=43366 RepID=A0AAN9P4G8_CLITE